MDLDRYEEDGPDDEEIYAEDYDVDMPPSVEIIWPVMDYEGIPF
jgi:hypothetical protein